MKKSYQAPQLVVHGTVAQLTQATTKGGISDKTYPVNTPIAPILNELPTNQNSLEDTLTDRPCS